MRYSRQRELIKKFVYEHNIHPTAEEVYAQLKPKAPGLSLATVYRNLMILSENGDIKRLRMLQGGDRFDGQMENHYHAVCKQCGKVFDIEVSLVDELREKIVSLTGMVDVSEQFLVSGICKECQK